MKARQERVRKTIIDIKYITPPLVALLTLAQVVGLTDDDYHHCEDDRVNGGGGC